MTYIIQQKKCQELYIIQEFIITKNGVPPDSDSKCVMFANYSNPLPREAIGTQTLHDQEHCRPVWSSLLVKTKCT